MPNSTKRDKGFTLLELMIVVSIISLLAAIALPAYQSYTIRAKISEAMQFSAYAKTIMWESYFATGSMPSDSESIITSIKNNMESSKYISQANYTKNTSDNASITITLINMGSDVSAGNNTLILNFIAEAGNVTLDCTGGSLRKMYRPAPCRSGS